MCWRGGLISWAAYIVSHAHLLSLVFPTIILNMSLFHLTLNEITGWVTKGGNTDMVIPCFPPFFPVNKFPILNKGSVFSYCLHIGMLGVATDSVTAMPQLPHSPVTLSPSGTIFLLSTVHIFFPHAWGWCYEGQKVTSIKAICAYMALPKSFLF